jgi:hypothetical protein
MGSHKPKVPVQSHTDPWIERRLDEELEQTFPASDALQITVDPPPAPKVQPGGQKPRAKRFARA